MPAIVPQPRSCWPMNTNPGTHQTVDRWQTVPEKYTGEPNKSKEY
jgi:hypothetical protein